MPTMKLIHIALFIYTVRSLEVKFEIKSFQMELLTNPREHDRGYLNMRVKMNPKNSMEVTNLTNATNLTNLTNSTNLMNSTVTKPMASRQSGRKETVAEASCRSLIPEKKQIDAVLSDMMNQLTLVFAKVNNFISTEVSKVSRKFLNADVIRRALETRFKVSHRKRRLIFDEIFNNMTINYRNVYNSTTDGVFRAGKNTCKDVVNQQLWNLLEYSLLALRTAMRSSMAEYLKEQAISPESALGQKVNKLLATEIGQIRIKQLNMLCDKFKLCNGTSTMLQEYAWLV